MSGELTNRSDEGMINIPGGEIELRDDRIKKKWKTAIHPFQLSKYPVTQDSYFAVTQKAPSAFKGARNPVENVSWNEAVDFCNQLSQKEGLPEYYAINNEEKSILCNRDADGYRLPTEAEWQYACQAGNKEVRYGEIDKIA